MKLRWIASLALMSACSDDPKRPPPAGDSTTGPPIGVGGGGTSPEGGAPSGDAGTDADGGTCTDLVNAGPLIAELAVNDELPSGTGGTPSDGTYELTDARIFQGPGNVPGPTGDSFQITIRIAGASFERVARFQGAGGATFDRREAGTFTVTSPNGTIVLTCPNAATEQVTYTAATDSLTLSNVVTKESFTFAKKL